MFTIAIRQNDHTHTVFDVSEMIARKVILRSVAASEISPFDIFQAPIPYYRAFRGMPLYVSMPLYSNLRACPYMRTTLHFGGKKALTRL